MELSSRKFNNMKLEIKLYTLASGIEPSGRKFNDKEMEFKLLLVHYRHLGMDSNVESSTT
jgi:hypothetical protein